MALNFGDAVMRFFADSSQLDQAVADAPAKARAGLQPVQDIANSTGDAIVGMGAKAAEGTEKTAVALKQTGAAATEMGAAVDKASKESAEAIALAEAAAKKAAEGTKQATNVISGAWFKVAQLTRENAEAQVQLGVVQKAIAAGTLQGAEATTQLATAQQRAALVAHELAQANNEATISFKEEAAAARESKAAFGLAGEEIGIGIPRHIRGFLSSLPGVSSAMSAAFNFFAIAMVVQLLVEATQKLSEFVAETLIYTEADKEAYKAQVELNNAILEQTQRTKELRKERERLGMTPLQIKDADIKENVKKIADLEAALKKGTDQAKALKAQLTEALEQPKISSSPGTGLGVPLPSVAGPSDIDVEKVKENLHKIEMANEATKNILTGLRENDQTLQAKYDRQALEDKMHTLNSEDAAVSKSADAQLDLWRAQSRVKLAMQKVDYVALGALDSEYEDKKEQLERNSVLRRLAAARLDPTTNADLIETLNHQLEDIDTKHHTRLLQNYINFREQLRTILSKKIDAPAPVPVDEVIKLDAATQKIINDLKKVEDAMASIGQVSYGTLLNQKLAAQEAFGAVIEGAKKGAASELDLIRAHRTLLAATIALSQATGKPWKEDQKQLELLDKKIGQMTGTLQKQARPLKAVTGMLDAYIAKWREAKDAMIAHHETFDGVMGDMSATFGSAVSDFLQGQESMGRAMEKALAQYLGNLASKAAADALYFTAWGIADLFWDPDRAAGDFAAAAEFAGLAVLAGAAAYGLNKASAGSGSSGGSGTAGAPADAAPIATQGAASQPDATPIQSTNVHRFGVGAVVSRPTLAVIGDAMNGSSQAQVDIANAPAAKEAILPLDSEEAMKIVGHAIGQHITVLPAPVHVHGKGMKAFIKAINYEVEKGGTRLVSSVTHSVRKKS